MQTLGLYGLNEIFNTYVHIGIVYENNREDVTLVALKNDRLIIKSSDLG